VTLIVVQQVNDIPNDFSLLLILEVFEVLIDARRLEVIAKELVIPDLSQLSQYLILVVTHVINIKHSLPSR
jgi:hypothetical protein